MRQRLIFAAFLMLCFFGFWNLRYVLEDEKPNVTAYPAREELEGDFPALSISDVNVSEDESDEELIAEDVALNALQRMQNSFQEEQALPDFTCNMAPVREVTEVRPNRIYQRRDDEGNLHFSDVAPANVEASVFNSREPARLEYFRLEIDFMGGEYLPFFKNQIEAQAGSMYEILSEILGRERLKQVDLMVLIFPDRSAYQAYASARVGPALVASGGFYSNETNEAVTYQYEDSEQTLAVTRHEAAHVMLNGMLAAAPLWLHEGMAEYFERLSMRQQYAEIRPQNEWLIMARESVLNGYPLSLEEFLITQLEQWRAQQQAESYALSWSLIYFLLDNNSGRRALAALLQKTADDYCVATDGIEVLNQSYPGGLMGLQNDFYSWLGDDRVKRPHTY